MRALRAAAREQRIGLGYLTCIGGVIVKGALRGWWRRRSSRLGVCVCLSDGFFDILSYFGVCVWNENIWTEHRIYTGEMSGNWIDAPFADFCSFLDPYVAELWTFVEAMVYAGLDDTGNNDTSEGKKEKL